MLYNQKVVLFEKKKIRMKGWMECILMFTLMAMLIQFGLCMKTYKIEAH